MRGRLRVRPLERGFTSRVTVTNTGTEPLSPWKLTWTFADDQRVTHHWSSRITQTGRDVTAHPASWNGTITPGGSVDFGFNGTSGGGAADPTAFTLNGAPCTTG
ncbi:cellulose binding domain-containing protein [Streptomyces zhihengii]